MSGSAPGTFLNDTVKLASFVVFVVAAGFWAGQIHSDVKAIRENLQRGDSQIFELRSVTERLASTQAQLILVDQNSAEERAQLKNDVKQMIVDLANMRATMDSMKRERPKGGGSE